MERKKDRSATSGYLSPSHSPSPLSQSDKQLQSDAIVSNRLTIVHSPRRRAPASRWTSSLGRHAGKS
ncbi:hypothetical protein RRG08_038622 [Elysia crispata]|uniref:Uncharacterized protein n=1 Tax=Elysia crispata TaxID=231223 RepID=A0AAE0YKT9_9GAST|nr:hypothetical protein RRG08_038622 [Elysia crispata]